MQSVICFICLAAYSTCDILDQEEKQRARYIEFIDDDGVTHLLDTKPKQRISYRSWYMRDFDTVNFLLYTKRNKLLPQPLAVGNISALKISNFSPEVSTIFIVHGWWSGPNSGPNPIIRDAYLTEMDVNVIVVDWSEGAKNPDYYKSVNKVPGVGRQLAQFIMFLNKEAGASFDDMHLIGHSLGAHVVGNAGRGLGGNKVARITALDPAGPLWADNPERLQKTDAHYVEAIHTNGGPAGLGTLKEWGLANFYPNGGIIQPGCYLPTCSHSRSFELFASTVKFNNLMARKCFGIAAMLFNFCNGELSSLGNSDLMKSGSGIYRVDTSSLPPYTI